MKTFKATSCLCLIVFGATVAVNSGVFGSKIWDVLRNDSSRIARLTRVLNEDTLTEIANQICGIKFGKDTEEFTDCLDDVYFTYLIEGIESGAVHDRLAHWAGKEKPEESDADLAGHSRVHDLNTNSFEEYVSSIVKNTEKMAEGRSFAIVGSCLVILGITALLLLFLAYRFGEAVEDLPMPQTYKISQPQTRLSKARSGWSVFGHHESSMSSLGRMCNDERSWKSCNLSV